MFSAVASLSTLYISEHRLSTLEVSNLYARTVDPIAAATAAASAAKDDEGDSEPSRGGSEIRMEAGKDGRPRGRYTLWYTDSHVHIIHGGEK